MILARLIEHTFDNAELAQVVDSSKLRTILDQKQRELEERHGCPLLLCHVGADESARKITIYWRRIEAVTRKHSSKR